MFRRQFVQLITLAGAGSMALLSARGATDVSTITYHVKGFSCVTCAVGLDTMLQKHRGIQSSQSTYRDGRVIVTFAPEEVSDMAIRQFIHEMGFTVEDSSANDDAGRRLSSAL